MESLPESYRMYIKRNPALTPARRKAIANSIRYVRRLTHVNPTTAAVERPKQNYQGIQYSKHRLLLQRVLQGARRTVISYGGDIELQMK
ncbi:MAG: hypothetical protein IPP17_30805 [Bacteroidetes bacterium]|nr:hypothetical protein [Bacteroidota bacterium]